MHLVDPSIAVSQWAFIDKLNKCYDQPWKTTISINTNLSTIAQHSFTDVMTHIAEVARQVNAKMEIYDRADAFDSKGSIASSVLEGRINANKTAIVGGSSTWYTDKNGNMVFVSSDGQSAMTLAGNGFAIANSKDAYGEWVWRTFGDGQGFTADLITAGTVAAGRVVTSELMSYLNENLVLSSNQSIILIAGGAREAAKNYTDTQIVAANNYTDEQVGAVDTKADEAKTAAENAQSAAEAAQTAANSKIYAVKVEYRLSTSSSEVLPVSSQESKYQWSTTAPTWEQGAYMWQRTSVQYAENGSWTTKALTCIQGAKGQDGQNGQDGKDGKDGAPGSAGVSITGVANKYKANNSNTNPPISGWVDNVT